MALWSQGPPEKHSLPWDRKASIRAHLWAVLPVWTPTSNHQASQNWAFKEPVSKPEHLFYYLKTDELWYKRKAFSTMGYFIV